LQSGAVIHGEEGDFFRGEPDLVHGQQGNACGDVAAAHVGEAHLQRLLAHRVLGLLAEPDFVEVSAVMDHGQRADSATALRFATAGESAHCIATSRATRVAELN